MIQLEGKAEEDVARLIGGEVLTPKLDTCRLHCVVGACRQMYSIAIQIQYMYCTFGVVPFPCLAYHRLRHGSHFGGSTANYEKLHTQYQPHTYTEDD